MLSKVQDWATAFQGKDSLKGTELVKSYEKMKSDGLQFPARDPTATAAMVDSLSVSGGALLRVRADASPPRQSPCRGSGLHRIATCD